MEAQDPADPVSQCPCHPLPHVGPSILLTLTVLLRGVSAHGLSSLSSCSVSADKAVVSVSPLSRAEQPGQRNGEFTAPWSSRTQVSVCSRSAAALVLQTSPLCFVWTSCYESTANPSAAPLRSSKRCVLGNTRASTFIPYCIVKA